MTSSDKIGDILNDYPDLYEVFRGNGFPCSSAADLVGLLGKDTMLVTALNVKGIDVDLFTDMLNARINDKCLMDALAYDFYNPALPVNLLVKTACPVSMFFKEELTETLRAHQETTGKRANVFIVDGCHAPHEFQNFWEQDSIDKLPDIIMSMSFDEIYDKRFIDKYVNQGCFANALKNTGEDSFQDDDYTLNAGLAMVFLVDEKNLDGLPKPKKWEDLLDPIYANKIIGFGDESKAIFEYPLYYLYKEFGLDSMRKLAYNTKSVYHAAKAAKLAGTASREAGGIYYLPLTFARLCENKNVSIVFPEDGALIIPIAFLVKRDKVEELNYLIQFLLKNYGQMCADINAAVFHNEVKSKIPAGTKMKWLGWDFIKSNDVLSIGGKLQEEFHQAWNKEQLSRKCVE